MTIADRSLRTDGLLPGEPADSDYLDDVRHWLTVYEELTGFLREAEAGLVQRAQRYQQRLAHWRRRHDELAGGLPEGASR